MLQCRLLRLVPSPCWLALCVTPALVACDSEDDGSLPGDLGNNHFFYECASIDDPQCREELTEFPEKLAVGARFDLHAKEDNGSSLFVEAASPVIVTPSTGEFEFAQAGFSAFLAFDDDGKLADFAHVRAADVASLGLEDAFGRSVNQVLLGRGQKTTITVVPRDAEGDMLAGTLTYRWLTDNEEVVRVDERGTSVKFEGLERGTAQVQVSLGDEAALLFDVVVEGAIVEDGGAGPSDAEAPDARVVDDGGAGDAAVSGEDTNAGNDTDGGAQAGSVTDAATDMPVLDASVSGDAGGQQ